MPAWIGLIGAGRMGRGIAQAFAFAGHEAILIDIKRRPADQVDALRRECLAEIDAVVADYLGDRGGMEAVDAPELRRRLRDGDVTVLDVRPQVEYEAGHIRGAQNVPFDELTRRLRDLPRGVEIVAYCRGPYCVFADEAVARLVAEGYRARRLTEGFPDWRSRGFPVETGAAPGG